MAAGCVRELECTFTLGLVIGHGVLGLVIGYHDPIANDPTVVPDPTSTTALENDMAGSTSASASANSLPWPLLIIAALAAWAMEEM